MNKRVYGNFIALLFGLTAMLSLAGFYNFSMEQPSPLSKLDGNAMTTGAGAIDFGQLPLSFEINQGQMDERVKFLSRGNGYALFLTEREAVLRLRKTEESEDAKSVVLKVRLDGANRSPAIVAQNELTGKSNYFVGGDSNKWKTDVPNFSSVRYSGVYPGIDQVFYGNGRQLEYDFIVAPEVDSSQIALEFEGASDFVIAENGDLVLSIGGEQIVQERPVIYQEIDGERQYVAGNYELRGENRIGFQIGAYDRTKPLTIDPVLVYSTYLGGNDSDRGDGIAIDNERNVYVTGQTFSTNFPTVNPMQPTIHDTGRGDIFVTKINAAGNAVLYSTYIGGSVGDIGHGIDVDNAGNAYVSGTTGGTTGANDFPTTPGAFDRTFNAPDEAVLLKLNASGNALIYSTYIGASVGFEVKVNKATGEAFVAGNASDSFPTTPGAFRTTCSAPCTSDGFITKFNADGSALVYSTYIGPGPINDLAIDAQGNAYVTGSTISNVFPVTPGAAQPTCTGCNLARSDAFITKLNPTGSALVYSTYLGGSVDDAGYGIIVDRNGNAYVTGAASSYSANAVPFPTTPGAFQPDGPGAFITKLNPTGTSFVYSTFIGVRGTGYGIAVDPAGNAHVIGKVRTTITLVNPISSAFTPGVDHVFITTLNPTGSALLFSTFFGPGEGREVVADNAGNIYVTGRTFGSLPLMKPIQPNPGGGNSTIDAFVSKIEVQRIQARRTQFDSDGDGKADIVVFRPSDGNWYILRSSDGSLNTQPWGLGALGDHAVPADYDGDGKTDIAVWRESDGRWYILQSSTNTLRADQWGANGDKPVPADFDGDGKADLAVYRPSEGRWYILQSSNNGFRADQWGASEDKPVPADYDGDGRADLGVFRPSEGMWYIYQSATNSFRGQPWGLSTDKPVPADYDGDGKTDLAVFRPGEGRWYILKSTDGSYLGQPWGRSDDVPQPADYDGDGRADLAVWRATAGAWYILKSFNGEFSEQLLGNSGDVPVSSSVIPY